MAHQVEAYSGLSIMKQLGIFLLSPGWDASPALNLPVFICTPGWRGTAKVKCVPQEHDTMSPVRVHPVRVQTQTPRSRDKCNFAFTTQPNTL